MQILIFLFPLFLFGLPLGGLVVEGSAAFSYVESRILEIVVTRDATIHWDAFSLEKGERVRFKFCEGGGMALNRVAGREETILEGRLEGDGGEVILINENGIALERSGVVHARRFLAKGGKIAIEGMIDVAEALVLDAQEVAINSALVWDTPANIRLIVEQDCAIRSILGSLSNGNFELFVGGDLILASSLGSMAQLFTQGGDIEIAARDIRLVSTGTPTEILAMSGNARIRLGGNLHLISGNLADAFARVAANNIDMEIAGNAELFGGGGSRTMGEIFAGQRLKLGLAGNLKLEGGFSPDRSFASICGVESAELRVGGAVHLRSGPGDSVQISSRSGSLDLQGGAISLSGHPEGGTARFRSADHLYVTSNSGIDICNGGIFSQNDVLTLSTPGCINAAGNSILSSPISVELNAEQVSLKDTQVLVRGGASID